MNKTTIFLVAVGTLFLLSWLIFQGVLVQPIFAYRKITRKAVYPAHPDLSIKREIGPAVLPSWTVHHPNVRLYTLVTGGLGNTLVAYAAAVEACRFHGLRPSTLLIEQGADFDFHNVKPSRHRDLQVKSMNDILPWTNTLLTRSMAQTIFGFTRRREWFATSLETVPLAENIVQLTNYNNILPIQPESFEWVRQNINKEIFDYIAQYYAVDFSRTMAVHMRMGQPTDDFIPLSPIPSDIESAISAWRPERILLFTDDRERAESRTISKTNLQGIPFEWMQDTNYVECLLIGLCASAVISHSTFSIVGCRLFDRKNVRIVIPDRQHNMINLLDSEWQVVRRSQ